MRRALGTLLVFGVMAAGCLRSPGGKAGETLAGAGFVYGIACADYGDGQHRCESTDAQLLGAAILIALVGGTALAIYSEATYKPPAVAEPAAMPEGGAMPALYEPVAARDPEAHELAVEAHRAAWQGQCAGLAALAQRVNAIDPEYYASVFYPDPAIQRCMQAR